MARGKGSLKDSVKDSEIVRKGEVLNPPNFVFADGEFGITGKYKDYSLVQKKLSYRTGNENDGEDCGKVIEYTKWEDYPCYCSTLTTCFESYAEINKLSRFKAKKFSESIKDLYDIQKETRDIINKSLEGFDNILTESEKENLKLRDMIEEMKVELEEAKQVLLDIHKVKDNVDDMESKIKEKKYMIVDRDKPKFKRVKEEE